MKIGGLQRLTLIDYPGKTACTVFLAGCDFLCPWCYAPELVLREKIRKSKGVKEEEFFSFLKKRKGKLDGVVICGGEPTIHKELSFFIDKIKKEGFLVKLDTNGSHPEVLKKLITEKKVDYVAMDVKVPLEEYKKITGTDPSKIKESIAILLQNRVRYEFRSTAVPGVHSKEKLKKMARMIEGAERYFLQNFLPEKTIEKAFLEKKPFSKSEMEEFKKITSPLVKVCKVR